MQTSSSDHPIVDVLRSRNNVLADQASRLISQAARFQEYTLATFPGFTDHTHRHTRTVEKIARLLLSDEFLSSLSSEELFFFAVACHYHDLAIAGTEADDKTGETRDQLRRDHAIRIGQIVRDKWAELGFENPRWAEILGEVCRGHRPKKNSEGEATWDDLSASNILGPGVVIRVRLLSALIYAVDELHLGADRAPEHVQRWREIQEDESRRHWRRHQAISGPAPSTPGTLLFQVAADSPDLEMNLSSQVFVKALSALKDLRRQADADGLPASLPRIIIDWRRTATWELLLPIVCADMKARRRDEIIQLILDRFRQATSARIPLDGLCGESGNSDAELFSAVCRITDDAITSGHLIVSPGPASEYVLSVVPSHCDTLFERTRVADDLDVLFVGRYRRSWEQELFSSEFGRTYIRRSVFPAIERAYSVWLTQRPTTDPLRVLLEACPSAARMAATYSPSSSNLAKDALLTQVAITGALLDIHSEPERLLDGTLRTAIRGLAASNGTIMPVIRLLEELALLGGFTHEQISSAACISDAAKAVILQDDSPDSNDSVRMFMTQSVPVGAGETTHLPGLILASQRAGTPIRLTTAAEHKFTFRVEGDARLENRDNTGAMVEFGPGTGHRRRSFSMPARLEVNRPARTVRLRLGRFGREAPTGYPLVVKIPAPPPEGQTPRVTLESAIQWSELTVRDWRALEAANQVIRSNAARIELIVEEGSRQLAVMDSPQGDSLFATKVGPDNIQRAFRGLPGDTPSPVLIRLETLAQVAAMSSADREAHWRRERDRSSDAERRVSAVFLRLTTPEGHPFEEEFLRFFPFDFFPAPTFKTDHPLGVEEIRRQWTEGENDFTITSYFHNDIHELADLIRTWCGNPSEEFPFSFDSEGTPTPVTRSLLTVRLLRSRDRVWHRDRPIIFEFRPVNPTEAYAMEATYWRSIGDEPRAVLAEEIRDRIILPTDRTEGKEPAT